MKTKIILLLLLLSCYRQSWSQVIPSLGFESWEQDTAYENPQYWNTGAMNTYMNGQAPNVIKSTDRHGGNYSMRLSTITFMNGTVQDTSEGFAINSGNINGSMGTLVYEKGFPFTAQPDSVYGWFKPQFAAGDTGIFLVTFKKNGLPIYENIYPLFGNSGSWIRLGFDLLPFAQVPDTCIIAVTSSNPNGGIPGSVLYVDDLYFPGGAGTIPNGDMEIWQPLSYQEPVKWNTVNLMTLLDNGTEGVKKDTSHHGGQYSMSVETIQFSSMFGGGKSGYATTGRQPGPGGLKGGFPFSGNPTVCSGWYKYTPGPGNDTARIFLVFSKWDTVGDSTIYVGVNVYDLPAAPNWTQFSYTPMWNMAYTIDTANFFIVASKQLIGGAPDSARVGSKLWLDDLWLGNACNAIDTLSNFIQGDSSCDYWVLHGRAGFNTYSWSTGGTALSDTVTQSGTYLLTVSDSAGCNRTDSISVIVTPCIGRQHDLSKGLEVFPNPARSYLRLRSSEGLMAGGNYTVSDMSGRVILNGKLPAGHEMQLDVAGLNPGMYLIQLECEQGFLSVSFARY